MNDPYLYPNSEVLMNLANIHDVQGLKDMEADYTLYRLSELVTNNDWERFDFKALCEMHHHIFQDVYEWAGKPRIINIEKQEVVLGELSIEYSDCFDIERDAKEILVELNRFNWKKASNETVIEKFSSFMASLWKVHLFREGNTRTVVTFCCMFIEAQGIYIDSDLFKDNASYMRDALVAANAMFHDLGDLRKPEYLYRIVQDALERGHEMKVQVETQIRKADFPVTDENIRRIVFWNRKEKREHTDNEIRAYLSDF